ncbi:MAG TPA: DUF3047 domain-containing protein [Dissulfurispiraceae bacterium]
MRESMRPERRDLLIAAVSIVLLLSYYAAFVRAVDVSSLVLNFNGSREKGGIPRPWTLKLKEGRADVGIVPDHGEHVLHVKSASASFALERDFIVEPSDYPYMIWTWRAAKLPLSGDIRKEGFDDQALQILVAFENRRIINYVWDSNAPEGTVADESIPWPVSLRIKAVVVRSGASDAGRWVIQKRNIQEDYHNLFHEPPPRIKGIRIQTNTQYTKGVAEGYVRNIVFSRTSGTGS